MKKVLALTLVCLLIIMSLIGCAKDNQSNEDAKNAEQQTKQETEEVTVENKDDDSQSVIQLWDVIVRSPHPEARDLVISEYEKNYNNKVEVTTLTGDINQKVQTAAAGGTLPDLLFTWGPDMVVTWGQMGITTPVDDVISEYGEDWFLSSKQLDLYKMDEQTWGVPIVTFPVVFWYRSDWFEEASISVPKTWDEWYDAALELTQDTDGDGEVDQYGSLLAIAEGWPFSDIRGSNADYWWDEDGNLTFSDKSIETLDFIRKLFDDTCYPGSVSYKNEGQRLGFLSDQGATMVTSISFINTIIEEKGLEWIEEGNVAISSVPLNASVEEGAGSGANTHAIGVIDGPNADLAKEFLSYWMSESSLELYFSNNIPGHLPPYSAVWDSEKFQEARKDYWNIYLEGKEIIATTQWFHPTVKWQAQFDSDGGNGADVMTAVTVEKLTSEEIIDNLTEIANEAKDEISD